MPDRDQTTTANSSRSTTNSSCHRRGHRPSSSGRAPAVLLTSLLHALVLVGAGCSPATSPSDRPGADGAQFAASTKNELLWKRTRALQNGLAEALAIPPEDVCNELGRFPCIDLVHQVPLGGNDPFEQGLYEPLRAPSTTTALSFDRVVLSACSIAVEIDAGRAAQVVFRGHALTADPLVDEKDAIEGARILGATLIERFHGRAAQPRELEVLEELLVDDDGAPVSGMTFAKLACFAVASTTETLFY
jgi:hypothetical protein